MVSVFFIVIISEKETDLIVGGEDFYFAKCNSFRNCIGCYSCDTFPSYCVKVTGSCTS